jgi:membrane protein DedA with SNARE-associated domain
MNGLEHMLTQAEPWLHHYGYPAVAVAVMLEGAGIPLPGAILMGGAALLAGQGELNVLAVWLVACVAAVSGDNLGYWIGRSGGRRLLLRFHPVGRRLGRFEGFYQRFGIWLILFGRFFDGTRQLNGLVAGSASMPWPGFLAADAAGSTLWVSTWVVGLYALERHAAALHRWLAYANPWVAGGALVALALTLYLLFHRNAPHNEALPGGEPASGASGLRDTRT